MQTRLAYLRWLGVAPILLLAALASAQEPPEDSGIEEIVVLGAESEASADFGAGDSVTGFGAEDLAALGAQSIADLASFTPNLEIVTSGATTPTFFIRGVGLNDFNPNSTGAVSVYQDDVAINAPAIQLGTLFDVEAVNILRGPQGTGLARNSSAGAIKIYARKPSGEYGGFLRADFGNYDYQDYEGAVEAPIWEDLLAGRFAFRLSKRDGTMKNRCAGAPPVGERVPFPGPNPVGDPVDPPWSLCGEPVPGRGEISSIPVGLERYVNDTDNWAARGTLLFQPTLDMSWLVNAHGSRRDELSRLGQSIGTGGNFCVDGDICSAPFFNVPPELRGEPSSGVLGGTVNGTSSGSSYSPIEIRRRLLQLAPCLEESANCSRGTLDERVGLNKAKIKLANELASDLDKRPWEGDFDHTGPTENDTWGMYLKGDIALPWGLQLNTVSAYDTYDRLIDIDLDFSPETLFHIKTDDDAWQFYQDLSVKGQLELPHVNAIDWNVGAWYLREELDVTVDNDFGELDAVGVIFRDYTQDTTSLAGYGHVSMDFWKDFTLDGGIRYNWEEKEFDLFQIEGGGSESSDTVSETWDEPTGTVRLTYRFREDTHAFWKYTRGWKPGSFNATAASRTGITVADPESIDAFETGLRGSWFHGRFGIDASFFYYSYEDYQIFTAQQFLGGNPEFVILNSNDAEVYGTEVDATARPWDGAFWNVRFSWLESQFLDFVKTDQFLASRGGQGDLVIFKESQNSGNQLLNSPRFKVSITGEQSFPLARYGVLTFRYDGVWTDTTFYDPTEGLGLGNDQGDKFLPDDTIGQEDFWIHNLRLSWRSPDGKIEVAGWIRNLEDEAYKTFAFDGSTFRNTTIYFVGDPRTYGATLVVNF